MSDIAKTRREGRLTRHRRVRKKIHGTAERPRLAVYRSNRHLTVQVIDDDAGRTLAAASTIEPDQRAAGSGGSSKQQPARHNDRRPCKGGRVDRSCSIEGLATTGDRRRGGGARERWEI